MEGLCLSVKAESIVAKTESSSKLAIWGKLQNCPSDGIDIDCHCGCGGSSNVEETVCKILEACVTGMLNEFHWSRHPTGQVSIVVLEKHTVELPGAILKVGNSISGQDSILETCIVTIAPLKICDLCPCCEAGAGHTLLKDKPAKQN